MTKIPRKRHQLNQQINPLELRKIRRRMPSTPLHPIYVERLSKEHALLEDLIRRDPPVGGLAELIKSMDG